ncbi:hypothetical protein, variant 3 [Cladophialophora immunda]|nr:hypothetical protein, variant 1 [Cladophialophora immunda]XP_016247116.1 hypothetical protein, variant 2 [Cladophialophora immunda]XP_016247117.1 hypothetical protein, variant 3 [Cladophialophora immunda]KIW26899.1 hypothetical protein, variant 1 [Cladophialophora immunda]KIW26900.1 hypothetical protein, variant 2 [Cladophialophora immunda]KIW26901.1 hypothetical protein, variant 3 [Cladophialophora immunda]
MYIERLNNCTVASCNATDQEITFSAIAEICAIFSVPVTIGPEATVSTSTSNPLFSTVAIPSQSTMPPATTPTSSSATVTSMSTSGASTSTSSTTTSPAASATSTGLSASPSQSSSDGTWSNSPAELMLILGAGIASLVSIISL